jgi:hypothetical protein
VASAQPCNMTDVKRLEQSLRSLRSEIDALGIGDEEARQRLGTLVAHVERAIDAPGRRDDTLGEQLRTAILKMEVSHPRVAAVLNEVVESLGRMGI